MLSAPALFSFGTAFMAHQSGGGHFAKGSENYCIPGWLGRPLDAQTALECCGWNSQGRYFGSGGLGWRFDEMKTIEITPAVKTDKRMRSCYGLYYIVYRLRIYPWHQLIPYACTANGNRRFCSIVAQAPSQSDQYSLDRFRLVQLGQGCRTGYFMLRISIFLPNDLCNVNQHLQLACMKKGWLGLEISTYMVSIDTVRRDRSCPALQHL